MDSFMKAVSSFKDKIVKTPLERLVHDACTDENWGVPNTALHQISEKTFNHEERSIIMRNIWELLSSPAKEWRRLYKVLNLLDHLLKFGSTSCSNEIQDNVFKIRMFQDFSFREGAEEKGIGVRDKAKYLLSMLSDASVLNEERDKAQKMWNKFNGGSGNSHFRDESYRSGSGYETPSYNKPVIPVQDTYQEKPLFNSQSIPKPSPPATSSQAPKYNLWEVPSMKTDAFAPANPIKSLNPPSGFHPSGSTASKPSLAHSHNVTSSTIDLLLDDSPSLPPSKANPSSALPQLGKASSMFEDLLISSGPVQAPNPPLVQFPPSSIAQNPSFPFTQPAGALPQSAPFAQPVQVKPSGTFNNFQPDLGLPTDLFSSGQTAPTNLFQPNSFASVSSISSNASAINNLNSRGPAESHNLIETSNNFIAPSNDNFFNAANTGFSQSSSMKLNINLSEGTSMEKMKSYGYSGFNNFTSASVKKQPDTLEGKLFNLDDLEAGQPKVKEVPKSKW